MRKAKTLRAEAKYGYCAAKDEKYFGFKGHIVTTDDGMIIDLDLTAANVDERDVLSNLLQSKTGMIAADKGLIRPELKQELFERGLDLETPLRKNMKDKRPPGFIKTLMNVRRKVETVIGQLTDRFKIQAIRAKDLWHLNAKFMRKILAHTFAFILAGGLEFDSILG